MTDFDGGIVIRKLDYTYPIWIYDVTKEDIGDSHIKVKELIKTYR